MSKFNVGDKVRSIKGTYPYAAPKGSEGTVSEVTPTWVIADFPGSPMVHFREDELESVGPKTLDEQAHEKGISAAQLLRKAADLLEGDRAKEYGGVLDYNERIAKDWTALFGREFTAGDVAMGMVAVKMSRMDADKTHVDSRVDMLTYKAVQLSYTLLTHSE